MPNPLIKLGIVLPCPTTNALPFNERNFAINPAVSFAAITVGTTCAAFAVGADVSRVRLNSVIKTAVTSESFRTRASASARF